MIEIKPRKHIAPKFVGYFSAVFMLAIIICFIYSCVTRNFAVFVVPFGIFIIYYLVFNFGFSWYKKATINKVNNCIEYKVQDIVSLMGKDITTYKIFKISGVVKKKHTLVINGEIEIREPMQKPRRIKQVKILDYTPEVLNLVENF